MYEPEHAQTSSGAADCSFYLISLSLSLSQTHAHMCFQMAHRLPPSSPQNLFSTVLCFLRVSVQSWSMTIMVSIITTLCISRGSSNRFPNQKRIRRMLATVSTKHTYVEKPSASLVRWIVRYCGINGTIPPNTIAACEPKVTRDTIQSYIESPNSCAIFAYNRGFPVTCQQNGEGRVACCSVAVLRCPRSLAGWD